MNEAATGLLFPHKCHLIFSGKIWYFPQVFVTRDSELWGPLWGCGEQAGEEKYLIKQAANLE